VSSDHLYSFVALTPYGSLVTAVGGPAEYLSKPDGSFQLVGVGSLGSERLAQGRYISEGGAHVIFSTGHSVAQSVLCGDPGAGCPVLKLEPNAPPTGTGAIYDRSADGPTHVVSLLPSGDPPAEGEEAFYQGASRDATSVAFKIGGILYVRVDNGLPGERTEEAAAADPTFAGLSDDGTFLFYVAAGNIYRFDTTDESTDQVSSTGDGEIVNVSADGSHVYFVSHSAINGQGAPGQPNLYVWSAGSTSFIRTIAASDLVRTSGDVEGVPALTTWTSSVVAPISSSNHHGPGTDSSRTTPDGNILVFESRAKLTGYENAGHTEIYRWDDVVKSLACISCNPMASSADADARLQELNLISPAMIVHNLSADGSRVFFETEEALVSRDTDEVNDVYEWVGGEGALGSADLISSGRSVEYPTTFPQPHTPVPNVLLAASPSGQDVFFISQDALTFGAPSGGAPAIYDARVNGGFPVPPEPVKCVEEGCRPVAPDSSPPLAGMRSETGNGRGNVKRRKHHRRRHCRQAKRKKQQRCHRQRSHKSSVPAVRLQEEEETPPTAASAGERAGAVASADAQVEPVSAAGPSSLAGTGEVDEFGIESVGAQVSPPRAAAHADFVSRLTLNHKVNEAGLVVSKGLTEEVTVSLPPGLLGNPRAVPRCTTGEFLALNCPINSQVGVVKLLLNEQTRADEPGTEPIYNLEPPHPDREVARLGFIAVSFPVFIDVDLRTASDYGVTATVRSAPGVNALVSAETILWGDPSDSIHDPQRLTVQEAINCVDTGTACKHPDGKRSISPLPAFMTNPSACQEGSVGYAVKSYQLPGQVFSASAPLPTITDCTGLPFAPTFGAESTSRAAGAPTGLKTKLVLPSHEGPDELATATMREARVTLPAGMQIAAGAANWIAACSDAQVGFHREVDANCPENSKLGTATITSPALSTALQGSLYQRTPEPGHPFGLWLVTDALGLHVKIPGELEPDPRSGRLTAVFRDLPQVPISEIDLDVWGGPRAPLQNPDRCGTYTVNYSFSPHSQDPAVTALAEMTIDRGCDRGFSPTLHAGVTDPVAGKFSPLVVDLTREDGQQELRGFELELPDGELAKIKGVPLCSDVAATSGSCPVASKIGSVTAATGPGPEPLWIPQPGKPQPAAYLAGPYEGSPFSVVTVAPAQAGPFDLGNVVVRSGLGLDPDTNRAVVKADPLPQFFEGVGLTYRRLRIVIDRPNFSLNPTDCRELAVDSTMTSTQGAIAHPASRFQVDGCKRLKFKPKLRITLKGGTERAAYPALTAILRARRGDANIARVSVSLPHSEFLAQEHIGTICTRKQFAAGKCPRGSVYGKAKANTPLLAKPLTGPVYLRSSNHPLPDLVVALGGELDVNLVGRIDSKNGGIRTTFEAVPDAPVTRFVLKMRGGVKSLLTNSTDICRGKQRATVKIAAQNGRGLKLRPPLAAHACRNSKS
jgi:hypothetical protein